MTSRNPRLLLGAVALAALVSAGCGDSTGSSSDTADSTTTTSTPVTTTSQATTTTTPETTTTKKTITTLDRLLEAGYVFSDDYVVETVFTDIDSGTGGLAIDADGNFYQADFGYPGHVGNSVYLISPDGSAETFVQSDDMESLTMTAFGADGELYQTSYGSNKVFRITGGEAVLVAEDISGPTGIVALEDGTLYVQGYNSGKIHRIDPDGTNTVWADDPEFSGPNGLIIGPDGTFYSVNHKDGGLFAIDMDGSVTLLHDFPWPTSHVAYLDGALYVTSRGAFIVYRYDLETGDVEIIAGNAEPGDQDGRGIESSFGRPNAITVGPDGALYTNHGDGESNSFVSIRRITYQP